MNHDIRPAILSDAAAILAAEQETALQPGQLVSSVEELRLDTFKQSIQELRHSGRYIVAEMKDRIVGHACLSPMGLKAISHVFRLTIIVHPGFRRQGISAALLSDLLQWAQSDSRVQKIELLVRVANEPAIQLYLKFGFVEEGRLHKRIRLPDGAFMGKVWANAIHSKPRGIDATRSGVESEGERE
ncbi:MAG: GNAT family N-acetyltransferase [Leptolyngbyaceae cyanobacterium MO_188.B28]|nr:GNAT family N-acetyltransferase [Leptolyngbyaceae cyanobacterium MO_188.B28]